METDWCCEMIIQWFPGHMVKARRLISENLKLVDVVCEIIDARIPISSRNPDLDELVGQKPRLIVFNRVDQADPVMNKKWVAELRNTGAAVIETDCKSGSGVGQLQSAVRFLLSDKIAAYEAKGQTGRMLRLMIVGIPNVGKSSLINRAAKRKAAQTSDRPGVTRGKQWINLGNGIELFDTPGVLWHKFEDQIVAENLAFTGAIRDQIMDIETLGARLMSRLAEYYPQRLAERYRVDIASAVAVGANVADIAAVANSTDETDAAENNAAGFDLLTQAAARRGFLLSGGEYDTERMAVILLDEFRGGKLGRITLEWI